MTWAAGPEGTTFQATSPDGAVTVTVRPDGSVERLDLAEHARYIPLNILSELILDAMRRARSGIEESR